VRALLTARKLLQSKNHDVEMSLRGGALQHGPTQGRHFRWVRRAPGCRCRGRTAKPQLSSAHPWHRAVRPMPADLPIAAAPSPINAPCARANGLLGLVKTILPRLYDPLPLPSHRPVQRYRASLPLFFLPTPAAANSRNVHVVGFVGFFPRHVHELAVTVLENLEETHRQKRHNRHFTGWSAETGGDGGLHK
jgi:hypothetical protein